MARRRKKDKRYIIFAVLYAVATLGATVIGFFGNSFFAYKVFDTLWADVLYLIFLSMLYVTAFVSEVLDSRKPLDVTANAFIFLGSLLIMLLMYIFGRVFFFVAEIYSMALLAFIATRCALRIRQNGFPDEYSDLDVKPTVAAIALIILAMTNVLRVKFVDNMYVAWSLIPAAVLFVAISVPSYILLKDFWIVSYRSKAKSILKIVCAGFCIFFISFIFSYTTVGTIDCVFDGDPAQKQYTVLDKDVNSGSSVTEFKIKVKIDGKTLWIPVPSTDYYELNKGDEVTINYYDGALGFAYWQYYDKAADKK